MKFYRLISADGDSRLAVEREDGHLADLTSLDDDLMDIEDVAMAASLSGLDMDEVARRILNFGEADTYDLSEIIESSREGEGDLRLDRPFDPAEVWAAGVT